VQWKSGRWHPDAGHAGAQWIGRLHAVVAEERGQDGEHNREKDSNSQHEETSEGRSPGPTHRRARSCRTKRISARPAADKAGGTKRTHKPGHFLPKNREKNPCFFCSGIRRRPKTCPLNSIWCSANCRNFRSPATRGCPSNRNGWGTFCGVNTNHRPSSFPMSKCLGAKPGIWAKWVLPN